MNIFAVAKFYSRPVLALTFAVMLAAGLSSCGQTGPLFQPPDQQPEQPPVEDTEDGEEP